MQEAPTSLMDMFNKATANPSYPNQRFELFTQLLEYLSSVFPLMPSPRKNDADALADHCAAEVAKFDPYKVFYACYYHLRLGTRTNERAIGLLMDTRTHPVAAIYLTLDQMDKYKSNHEQNESNLKSCETKLKELGPFGKAVSQYLWGYYYYKCKQDYAKAATHLNKAKEYPLSWYAAGEMYFTLTNSEQKNTEVSHVQAKQYLTQYLTNAAYITQPTAFIMLGDLYARERDYIGAARFYCIGKVCGLDAANQAYQRLRDNDDANKIAIQTWGACQTILDETKGQIVTLADFCQALDKKLNAIETFAHYYAIRGGIFTPANTTPAASSLNTMEKRNPEKCLVM